MGRTNFVLAVTVCAVVAAGCTPVQKGTVAGGAAGGATGAAIGHYATSAGGGPGALVGVGLGAATGAIAADRWYGDQDTAELEEMSETVDQFARELNDRDAALRGKQAELEKERAQQKALLEAYEDRRGKRPVLQAQAPAGVQVSSSGSEVTYTILSEVLFDSGKAGLTDAGRKALHQAAVAIRRDYPNGHIEVRGHTDNVPIRYSSFKSNWHLSCARALAVVHFLIKSESFEPESLAATGCADTRPVAPNGSAEGRRKNRRAELIVRPADVSVAELRASR